MSKWIKGDTPRSKTSKWYQITTKDGVVCLNYWYAGSGFWKSSFFLNDKHDPIIAYSTIDFLKPFKRK